jgi:hypothetical protein
MSKLEFLVNDKQKQHCDVIRAARSIVAHILLILASIQVEKKSRYYSRRPLDI